MTNLRKCLGVSTFAVLALAFCCLIIGQAAIAKVEKAQNVDADNSLESTVPLPSVRVAPGNAHSNDFESSFAEGGIVEEGDFLEITLALKSKGDAPIADGSTKALGDDVTTPFVIGDETALPFMGTGDVSTGTHAGDPGNCLYGINLCDYGYPCAPDQWWAFTPTADMRINATIGNGTYDGDDDWAMMITDGDAVTYLTCSDPAAGTMPEFVNVPLQGGHTYYVMVEALWGIGASAGAYQLDVEEYVPHPDFCTPMCAMATQTEAEACGARVNGGCYGNLDGVPDWTTAEVITGDPTAAILCGTLDLTPEISADPACCVSGIHRDADQWKFELTELTNLTIDIGAEIGCVLFMHSFPTNDCPSAFVGSTVLSQGQEASTNYILNPGWYAFSLRANTQVMRCGEGDYGDARYYIATGSVPIVQFDDCPLADEIAGDTDALDPENDPGTTIIRDLCPLTGDGVAGYWSGGVYLGYFGMPGNGWFRWTCLESGEYTMSTCSTPNVGDPAATYDLYMAVWDDFGCYPDYGMEIAFSDDGAACPGYESEVTFIAAEGLTYLISIGAWSAAPDCGDMHLEISHVGIPLYGDNCLDHDPEMVITSDQTNVFFNNLSANLDGPVNSLCSQGEFGGDVWFELQAWADGFAFAEFCEVNYDANLEVYEGAACVDPLDPRDPIRCNDDGCWQSVEPWPQYHGSYTSFPVVAGQSYLLRVGGWFRPPDYPLLVGGMGFGWFSIYIEPDPPTSPPANDFCVNTTPVALVDGVAEVRTGTYANVTRNDMDCDYDMFPQNMMAGVWEPFTVPAGICMAVSLDHFGTECPNDNGTRYGFDTEQYGYIGCPCDGDFIQVATTFSCLNNSTGSACTPPIAGGDFNGYHEFSMLPAGDYFFYNHHNGQGCASYWADYTMNVEGNVVECAYCFAEANIAACPPVAGASFIDAVTLGDIATAGTGCNAYEDFSAITTELYKGLPYTLDVVMGKQGIPGEYDHCGAWIDWNQNSAFFDPMEQYPMTRLAYTWSIEVTPPMFAMAHGDGASGECRLRVVMGSTADSDNPTECGGRTWGEVEDYVVMAVDLECGDFDGDDDVDADDVAFLQA